MKTWYYEIIVITIILSSVTFFLKNDLINWITTLAIILTFGHAQIGDRLQERQKLLENPTVECYHKLSKYFIAKEIVWIIAFLLMKNYAAIVGSFLFILYPYWRKYYRQNIKSL